jgi:hypothetical protein
MRSRGGLCLALCAGLSEDSLAEAAERYERIIATYSKINSRDAKVGVAAARKSLETVLANLALLSSINEKVASISAEFDARAFQVLWGVFISCPSHLCTALTPACFLRSLSLVDG